MRTLSTNLRMFGLRRLLFVGAAAAVSLTACGGSSGDSSSEADVASISAPADTTSPSNTETDTSVDPEDAFLAYTECMREHGIDLPDPQVIGGDGSGGGMMIDSESGVDPESDKFTEAEEACSPILDDAMGEIEVDPEREAEMREQMLEYAACMREQGIDFPDPVFDERGRVEMSMEGEPTDSQDEIEAAHEACADILGDGGMVISGAGPEDGE